MQHKSIFLHVILFLIFVITLPLTAAEEETNKVTFLEGKSLDEITAILKKENKLGMLYFGAQGCHWCRVLESEVFTVDSVIGFIESNFVPFKCGSDLRKKYKVFGIPHAIIIDDRRDVIDRIAGYYPADKYLKKISVSAKDNVSKNEPKKEKTYKNLKEAYESNPDDKKAAYDYAYKLMSTNDLKNALPVFESLTNISFDDQSKDVWLLLDLARCYEKLRPREQIRKKAIECYKRAIEIGLPGDVAKARTYGQLVYHYYNGKEYDKVIESAPMIPEYKKYENRRDARINYEAKFNRIYLPFAYYYIGEVDKGREELVKLFEDVSKEEVSYSILQRWCGTCQMYDIFLKEAEEWAGKAVELYYKSIDEEKKKLKEITDNEERKKAESNLRIGENEMCYLVLFTHARLTSRNGNYETAIEIWERLPELPEGSQAKHYRQRAQAYLGAVYIKSLQVEKGEKIFEEILNWGDKNRAYFYLIVVCSEYKIKIKEALEWVEKDMKKYGLGMNSFMMHSYAGLLFENGEVGKAIEWEEKAIEKMRDVRYSRNLKKYKSALKK